MIQIIQRMSLQQKQSPQQVLLSTLLQLPVLRLEQRIKQELELNPLLEVEMEEDSRPKEVGKEVSDEVRPVSDKVWDYVEDEVWNQMPFECNDDTVNGIRMALGMTIMMQVKNPICEHLDEIYETS